ncbi:NAD(P)H-hydrate dehydratase [Paracrocinitomix mangrovi]|uniref:NAD(P)H-hydrate dehydratase n=1 Tax=Paracrocinitomix mangrovi TaxID=2862509 RepID=UPI001C8D02C6|nr:NAD(P)H-hydrate dehydratase [Paracrocinitomix mangrovi]UKN02978.1 NAD(P)H-hydrate dehydratase [Paracrocinitomix mangrovi]
MSIAVYTSKEMQAWDQFTIEHEPISSLNLMERAATLACKQILGNHFFKSATIFCGPGNNGGDGLVIARLLAETGRKVQLYILEFGNKTADFESNFKKLPKSVKIEVLNENQNDFLIKSDIVIDAVFGSGLNKPVSGWIGQTVKKMGETEAFKIAIDIPSGLFATDNRSNTELQNVFLADETLTFMSPKMSFFYPEYGKYVGKIKIIDIGLHPNFPVKSDIQFLQGETIELTKGKTFDHKGNNGYLSLIGGLEEMSGAILLSTSAALKCGAGYTYTISEKSTKTPLNINCSESIWINVEQNEIPSKTQAISIGPGLGQSSVARKLLEKVLQSNLPTVVDADALNLIANNPDLVSQLPENCILTPHIGELKRLIGESNSSEELLEQQLAFSKKYKVFIIQKGAYSKLTCPDGNIYINSTGNPGMAKAGMGDTLTGIIGALLAKSYPAKEAAIYGMFLHGAAGDAAERKQGSISLQASDLINELPTVIQQFTI